jgi:hypothetical protein
MSRHDRPPKQTAQVGAAQTSLTVAVLAAPQDSYAASQVMGALRDAGTTVIDARSKGSRLDGLVVLLSEAAANDPDWRDIAEHAAADRLIPVRLSPVAARWVPDRLAAINWIDWRHADPIASLGAILGALYSDPARLALTRQLTNEAKTWEDANRGTGLLIDDLKHAERMSDLLRELTDDERVSPASIVPEYVAASLAYSRRLRRRRRRWRIGAAVLLLFVGSWAMDAVPQIINRSKMNRAAIVTLSGDGLVDQSTAWTAINAAQLLIEGTKTQKQLGRQTLTQALDRPWDIGEVDFIDSALAAAPFDHGRLAAILALSHTGHSGVAIVDPGAGTLEATFSLPRRFGEISADSNNHIVLSQPGLAVLDLRRHTYFPIVTKGVSQAWALRRGDIVSREAGELVVRDGAGKRLRLLGHYLGLDARGTSGGAGAVLAETDSHAISVLDASTGRVVLHGRLPTTFTDGALAPDGRHAAIAGTDGQVWIVGPGNTVRSTGIAVPAGGQLLWPAAAKLVVMSDGTGGTVVGLPGGETLGRICVSAPQLRAPHADPDAEVVTCDARGFWRLPPGPVAGRWTGAAKLPKTLSSRIAEATFDGSYLRLQLNTDPKHPRATGWSAPLASRITAAAWSPGGDQLLIGSDNGGVAILGFGHGAAGELTETNVPDAAPVSSVSWASGTGTPLARTSAGHTWRVPACDGCGGDDGLLAVLRRRIGGCFTKRQLANTTLRVQRRLGLRRCGPVQHL